MANLAISAVCNQQCAYCFTVDHLGRRQLSDREVAQAQQNFISPEAFQDRVDWLVRSAIPEARLLGGEPSLHPDFCELVGRARAAGLRVVVFSNGLMPESALACLEALSPQACTVLVNVNEPEACVRNGDHARRRETLRRLGERAFPGFTIYHSSFQPGFLVPLIGETGCKPVIRLGMAQPCLSGSNSFIHPNQYRAVAIRIVELARAAATAGVILDLDCGFVRCMFSDDDLQALQAAGARVGWQCSPILDVDVDGNVVYCYPLSQLGRLPLTGGATAADIRSTFEARARSYRQVGVYRECSSCALKAKGDCPGGCLSATMRRFRHTTFNLELPSRGGVAGHLPTGWAIHQGA